MIVIRRMASLMAILVPCGAAQAQAPDTVFIEELTWMEVRDAIAAGKTTVIIPIGGTEQNGPHILIGKHNYVVTFAANLMAQRLGNALVAPTIRYVPEGDWNSPTFSDRPGAISNPSPAYDALLDGAARSLAAHGFTDIVFIGDSGGNQTGMAAVAEKLNREWDGQRSAKVYALTDYYQKGREHMRAWMLAQYGWTDEVIGNHAGIVGTSEILFIYPEGIRADLIQPGGGSADAGVSGDPTKSTPEIGRMIIEFKVNAGLAQYRSLKAPPRAVRAGGR